MKNTVIILIFALGISTISNASPPVNPTDFDKLEKLFNDALPVSVSDIGSAYAGRCYYEKYNGFTGPNDATGSLLVMTLETPQALPPTTPNPIDPAQDGGPLFPPPLQPQPAPQPSTPEPYLSLRLISAIEYPDKQINSFFRFDTFSLDQARTFGLNSNITSGPIFSSGMDTQWSSQYHVNGTNADFTIRRSDNYLIVQGRVSVTMGVYAPTTYTNKENCYFYNELN